ncbi:MAG: tetratricopeptide repeat protein [candidate division Zixibacteria bacterium]|nr:tetratricopeptide repeat protein [candidate division Zixibacteria bacterium]
MMRGKTMKKTTYLQQITELVDKKEFGQASERLKCSFKQIKPELSLMEIADAYYKWGICFWRTGEYKKACYKLKTALFLLANTSDHLLYARIKNVLGSVRMRMGDMTAALETFNEAYVYYKRIRKYNEILHPLSNMARIHFILGNLHRSIEVLRQEESINIKTINDIDELYITRRNLARVMLISGDFNEVKDILESMEENLLDTYSKSNLFQIYGMLSTFKLDHINALSYLNKSNEILGKLDIAHDIEVCMEYLGLNEYFRGNYSKAAEYYRQVLDMPELTASAVAQTNRMLTDVYIAQGDIDLAEKTAVKAEKAIKKIDEKKELGALWRAYGQICAAKKDNAKARDYFSRSSELLRRIGARYELAQTCFACGKSPAFEKDERLSYLSSAHALFSEMGVSKRLEEIDEISKDLRTGQSTWLVQDKDDDSAPVFIAKNKRMREIVAQAEQLAPHNISVLLTGDTGTGKDLLSQYIHHHSGREGPFVMVNCAAIPNDMVEAELFGYAKGAFTGAHHARQGLIEMASDGTLYLNEIVDASLVFQAKLLEVLETHRVRRLGENKIREIDFRLICATNHDMEKELERNRFRNDFYHRIKELHIHLPPLNDRADDVPDLALHFMKSLEGFPENGEYNREIEETCRLLAKQCWPGNVRELRAELKRIWVLAHGDIEEMLEIVEQHVEQDSREMFMSTLEDTNWNRRETARRLGVSDGTVRNWIRKYTF